MKLRPIVAAAVTLMVMATAPATGTQPVFTTNGEVAGSGTGTGFGLDRLGPTLQISVGAASVRSNASGPMCDQSGERQEVCFDAEGTVVLKGSTFTVRARVECVVVPGATRHFSGAEGVRGLAFARVTGVSGHNPLPPSVEDIYLDVYDVDEPSQGRATDLVDVVGGPRVPGTSGCIPQLFNTVTLGSYSLTRGNFVVAEAP